MYARLNKATVSYLERGLLVPAPEQLARYMEVLADYEALVSSSGLASYLTDEEREQRRLARLAVGRALRAGKLTRQPCEVCGKETVAAHHRNGYDNPLDVVWLCSMHHGQEHYDMSYGRRVEATEQRRQWRREESVRLHRKHTDAKAS